MAEFLRMLTDAVGLICIAVAVYFLACILMGRGEDK
jgi:hypothetical protein